MKKLLLILFALMFSLPCEASLSHNTHLTHTGLKPVPKSFQVAKSHFLPNYQTGGFSFDNSEDISVACPTSVFMYTKDNCAYPNIPQYSCGGRYRVCGCDRDFAYSAAQCEAQGKVGGDQSCTVRGGSDSGTVYYTTCKCPSSYPKLTTGQKCVGGTECSYAGEKYCDSTSHIQCESNYKVCDQNKSGRSGSCTAGGVTKYIDCYCDENLYPQTNETCKADFGANAVVSGEICGNNERGKSCSCEPNALPDGYSESCGSQGYSASIDDGCGGTYYKCNDAGCGNSNSCGYLCVKDNRPKQTLYENINTGLIGDNTCVNSFFAYDSRDFNGNTITLKNITTHLKVNRPDSLTFWPYSKRAYIALIYGDTVYLEGTHNLTLEGEVDFADCGTGCNIRSQGGATIKLNGTCYYLPPGYHYQCNSSNWDRDNNCFNKLPPNAQPCVSEAPNYTALCGSNTGGSILACRTYIKNIWGWRNLEDNMSEFTTSLPKKSSGICDSWLGWCWQTYHNETASGATRYIAFNDKTVSTPDSNVGIGYGSLYGLEGFVNHYDIKNDSSHKADFIRNCCGLNAKPTVTFTNVTYFGMQKFSHFKGINLKFSKSATIKAEQTRGVNFNNVTIDNAKVECSGKLTGSNMNEFVKVEASGGISGCQ